MWQYNYTPEPDELFHHGIKGQKWGKRRFQNNDGSLTPAGKARYASKEEKRAAKIDSRIEKLEARKKANKSVYKAQQISAKSRFSKNEKKLASASAYNKAAYDTTEVTNNYLIARQKAKKDKNYMLSDEYRSAKAAYDKHSTQRLIYGDYGHLRIEQLKNQGKTEKQAKNKAVLETALATAASMALSAAIWTYSTNR